ncbi:MAG: DtxR family iron (metal) dependent repressor [Actinobacteria bacterium]|nr:MAG: DtxR family iron (metal) dependent repressor [Actinomycetota bacterium]
MGDLIDTTEMYLKTIYELEEDGVTPLRARIVERLGHSGPTVSQTVGRMERDGLLHVMGDRHLELTKKGRALAVDVMRKHRLAECLLQDIIGVEWTELHDEACRWEHVMSDKVEERLNVLLNHPKTDPFGNPFPGSHTRQGISLELAIRDSADFEATVLRIGEPIQADPDLIVDFNTLDLFPGSRVRVTEAPDGLCLAPIGAGRREEECLLIPLSLASHLFLDVD